MSKLVRCGACGEVSNKNQWTKAGSEEVNGKIRFTGGCPKCHGEFYDEIKSLKDFLLSEIIKDEREYCFDKSYCSDENWSKLRKGITREEAFRRSIEHYKTLTPEEILNETGDKYLYVVEMYNSIRKSDDKMQSTNIMDHINENIAKLSDEEQFLIATCVENILNGSHWGFMTKSLLKVYKNPLDYNNNLTSVTKLSKGSNEVYLVEAIDVKATLKLLQKVAPPLVDKTFIEQYIKKTNEARELFVKFVEKSVKGKGFKGYVGVNSINSTPTMTFNKERHKAFQLPIRAVLKELAQGAVGGALTMVNGNPINVRDLSDDSKLNLVLSSLKVSDGATSVVLPLAIKGSK